MQKIRKFFGALPRCGRLRRIETKIDALSQEVRVVFAVIRSHIASAQEGIMAKIDEAAQATADKVAGLEGKVDEVVVTLAELKALIGTGNTENAEAVLAQVGVKVDELFTKLKDAEDATDPTPDSPPVE